MTQDLSSSQPTRLANAPTLVLDDVVRTQRGLRRVALLRSALIGLSAALVTVLVGLLVGRLVTVPPIVIVVGAFAMAHIVGLSLAARTGNVDPVQTALWMEEQAPAGFALVTLVEQEVQGAKSGAMDAAAAQRRERLANAVVEATGGSARGSERIAAALKALLLSRLRGPALFLHIALVLLAWLLIASRPTQAAGAGASAGLTSSGAEASRAPQPIGAWRVRIEPPAYSGQPARDAGDVENARVLAGTRVIIVGTGALPDSAVARTLGDSAALALTLGTSSASGGAVVAPAVALTAASEGWRASLLATPAPTELRFSRGPMRRLLLLEGFADSLPRVTLELPARDSVLRRSSGSYPLQARVHDDLGLARGAFELIVSSGEGERFTARTVRVGAQSYAGARDAQLRAALDLDALKLGPGDIIHIRAVARDGLPDNAREWGTSETRSIRVARPAEYDSVSVEPAPPPEVDKSLLSQRMLLMLTEKLEKRRPTLSAATLESESRGLARDQARLRLAVGDAVFQRLSGESSAEHSHSAGDGHDHGVDLIGGKLAVPTGNVSATGMLEEGDDSPVIGINKPLLEAYNAMWDAGRALELADPKGAIPHMRVALAAIERARAASRLYLRGKPPTVILDLNKIRLAGKDTGTTNARTVRTTLPPTARLREARLLRAADLAQRDVGAARDTLSIMRLEVLGDDAALASALDGAIDALRRGGDATDAFVRARRVIGGVARGDARSSAPTWSRMGPP